MDESEDGLQDALCDSDWDMCISADTINVFINCHGIYCKNIILILEWS